MEKHSRAVQETLAKLAWGASLARWLHQAAASWLQVLEIQACCTRPCLSTERNSCHTRQEKSVGKIIHASAVQVVWAVSHLHHLDRPTKVWVCSMLTFTSMWAVRHINDTPIGVPTCWKARPMMMKCDNCCQCQSNGQPDKVCLELVPSLMISW